jgi:pyridoxamine 5'-phosphate oxidase
MTGTIDTRPQNCPEMKPEILSDFDPLTQLLQWREAAVQAGSLEPDAMTLACVGREGRPSARIVLFRGIYEGGVRFFTNYQSRKGRELEENPLAALLFFWPQIGRQIRLEGTVTKLSNMVSDEYFRNRPRGHQLNAWASFQSEPIEGMQILQARLEELSREYQGREVPRPPHWGGYNLQPDMVEFWTNGQDRFHDRQCYRKVEEGWARLQLSP